MKDEKDRPGEEGDEVGSGVSICDTQDLHMRELDSPRQKRKPRGATATLPLAATGMAILKGAKSGKEAMLTAGYSPWSARKPGECIGSAANAVAAAVKTYPQVGKTLRALRPKAIAVLDRGMNLEDGERPDQSHLQASALALKLGSEVGEDEPEGITDAEKHNAHREIRILARRAMRSALRRAEQVGVAAALDELVRFEASERQRFPRLAEIATDGPRATYGSRGL